MEAENNKNSIFREKSMERISSPEDLNDYVRVASPGVWLVLSAIVVLLAGFIIWGIYGNIETKVPAVVVSEAGNVTCYVREADMTALVSGMQVRLSDGTEGKLMLARTEAQLSGAALSEYAQHISTFGDEEWLWPMGVEGELPEGEWAAEVITEAIKPISFIFNN